MDPLNPLRCHLLSLLFYTKFCVIPTFIYVFKPKNREEVVN